MFKSERSPSEVVFENGLLQRCDEEEISRIVQAHSDNNPRMADDYKRGKKKLFSYFINQILQETEGRVNIQTLIWFLKRD